MKKLIVCLTIFVIILGCMASVSASDEITVMVNGKDVVFDQVPVVENGRTLVPLRAIFEAFDAEIEWDDATQTVIAEVCTTMHKEDVTKVKLTIGSDIMNVIDPSGETRNVTLDVPAKIINGRTLVPVRAISEAFGYDIEWIASVEKIVITAVKDVEYVYKTYYDNGNLECVFVFDSQDRERKTVQFHENAELDFYMATNYTFTEGLQAQVYMIDEKGEWYGTQDEDGISKLTLQEK